MAALLSVRPVNSSAALAAIIHDVGRSSRHDADVAGCQLGPAKGHQVVVRIHDPLLAAIDEWCAKQLDRPTRAEALRRLAAQAFVSEPPAKPSRKKKGD